MDALLQEEILSAKRRLSFLEDVQAKHRKCQTEIEEAICLLKTGHMDLCKVLDQFPDLCENRDFWIAFVNAKDSIPFVVDISRIVNKRCPAILNDKDLIVKYLCKIGRYGDVTVYNYLSEDLQEDEEVIRAFIENHLYFFISEHRNLCNKHPGFVASVLDKLPLSNRAVRYSTRDCVSELLVSDRNVVLAWVRAGGDEVPSKWNDDDEIIEELLKHLPGRPDNVLELSDRLQRDKRFMLKAIRSNFRYIGLAHSSLAKDWDLLLTAMADMFFFVHGLLDGFEDGTCYGALGGRAVKQVLAELTTRENFLLVLSAIHASTYKHHHKCALTMLGQGQETTQTYMKSIEEFLEVPSEENCKYFRRALKNLHAMGYR
jgi:hypothetical protein